MRVSLRQIPLESLFLSLACVLTTRGETMDDEDAAWEVKKRRRDKGKWPMCRTCSAPSPPSSSTRNSARGYTRAVLCLDPLHRTAGLRLYAASPVSNPLSPLLRGRSAGQNSCRRHFTSRLSSCSPSSVSSLSHPSSGAPPSPESVLPPLPSSLSPGACFASPSTFSSPPAHAAGSVPCSVSLSCLAPTSSESASPACRPPRALSASSANFSPQLSPPSLSLAHCRARSCCSPARSVSLKRKSKPRASTKARQDPGDSQFPSEFRSVFSCRAFPLAVPVFLFLLFSSPAFPPLLCAEALPIKWLGHAHRPPRLGPGDPPGFLSPSTPSYSRRAALSHTVASGSSVSGLDPLVSVSTFPSAPSAASSLCRTSSPLLPAASAAPPSESPGVSGPQPSSLGPKIQLGAPKYRKRAVRAGRQKTPKFPYSPKDGLFYDLPPPPQDVPLPPGVRSSAAPEEAAAAAGQRTGGCAETQGSEARGRKAEPSEASEQKSEKSKEYLLRVPPIDQRARRTLWIHRHLGRRDGTLSPVEDEITDLLLSHNAPGETTLDLASPLPASSASSPASPSTAPPALATAGSSPYLAHLQKLAFAPTLGLTAAELTRLMAIAPELLLPRRLAACSDALSVLVEEKKWKPEAVKRLLLHVPRALTSGRAHLLRWMREYRELLFSGTEESTAAQEGRLSDGENEPDRQQEAADRFLEAVALKYPAVFSVRRPKTKLYHFLKVLRQVRATRSEFKPAGWSILTASERAKIVQFLSSAAPPVPGDAQGDRTPAGEAPPCGVSPFAEEHSRSEKGPDVAALELEWYRGHYERLEEFEGEKLVEALAGTGETEAKSDGERRSEREEILLPLREDAARMEEAMKREEASVKKMFKAYPRLFSFGIEGNVRSKLLYLQNCMHKEVEEVFLFPQFLSYSLRRRIIPRHIALVNSFLLREKARRKSEDPLYREGKTLEQVRRSARTRKRWDDRMQGKKKLKLRLEQSRGLAEAGEDEGSVYDEGYWEKRDMLADEIVPIVDEMKGWRGLEPYQPFAMPRLPSLREMYATSDDKFMVLFGIPYSEFVSAKVDAEKVKNPQTLF
ncbi:unnamed protein product [Neospora caninum Liverpool]|uniref:mTERF n=1 Tax=Neospora caninum (strain Liverpool) TaxID=572307 RepID=F0VCY2_NEOCL|nr:uncharacterized protein NCLIV_012905 [Neospora caninum Liverpool]CBZ51497.1 unnamed protein product [Neospora caninum Liverpool]CEL65447.1 TPA: hypothetical protein BN1204_012905_1 [Neospora caninum Liverpool]|eukprot:XP_003881530.1 uncharacterized protein NCLIV_012905 [Neospora caninum Liverpool]